MRIRKPTLRDTAVIAEFNAKLAWETEHLRLDLKTVTAGVRALIKKPARGVYYLAELNGAVAGQLCLTYEWSDWRNGNFWWIQSVYVREDFRGRGVFSALFKHIQSRARKQKEVCGVRLYMEQENHRARRVYEKLGLKQTHYQVFEKLIRA